MADPELHDDIPTEIGNRLGNEFYNPADDWAKGPALIILGFSKLGEQARICNNSGPILVDSV